MIRYRLTERGEVQGRIYEAGEVVLVPEDVHASAHMVRLPDEEEQTEEAPEQPAEPTARDVLHQRLEAWLSGRIPAAE